MLLVADIGNTNITLGLFDGECLLGEYRINSHPIRTANYYGQKVGPFLRKSEIESKDITGIVIGSVVPKLTEPFVQMARNVFFCEPLIVTCDITLGLKLMVDNPSEVGADRICNAVAARAYYPKPAIVVDLGTATTFDILDAKGNYIGGAIAPGLITAATDLFRKAARLHRIDFEFPPYVIGKNTTAHLQSGILVGHLAMIEGMVQRIAAELKLPQIFVAATGGLSEVVAKHSPLINVTNPRLTLDGLRLIYGMNTKER